VQQADRRGRQSTALRTTHVSRAALAAVVGFALFVATLLAGAGAGAGPVAPGVAAAAEPTRSPFIEGRHVYDYGHLMSPAALARAETLAARIEADGGGRVVVYTADVLDLPGPAELAVSWNVTGLLLTGWDDFGEATLGAGLTAKMPDGTAKFIDSTSSVLTSFESWATGTLARVEGLISGKHVFDGTGVLDAAALAHAEASASALSAKIGIPVYVDIAFGEASNPEGTAYWNSDLNGGLGTSLVIALAVADGQIGGHVEAATAYSEAYMTGGPWSGDSLWSEVAPQGDVQAELLRAIDSVGTPIDPVAAFNSVVDAGKAFAGDERNQRYSAGGLLIAVLALMAFWLDRRRRRRDAGYGDDDSVLLPAPPADMTPALAALVAAPLNTTRAVTTALLDLAAHGYIAFYQSATPLGPTGAIKVMSGVGNGGHASATHGPALDRPLGPAETMLLDGLRAAARNGSGLSGSDFAELRPLFEQTGEQLERIAGERGWLRLRARSISLVWGAAGLLLLAGAGGAAYILQPVAAASLGVAGLAILPRAMRMPLPVRTRDGQMTSAMVDAYRRTLRRALAGGRGSIPPWLANAEEAALWGYAWGLEGEVQAFVAGNVSAALTGAGVAGLDYAGSQPAGLRSMSVVLGGMYSRGPARPIGLDTDAIAETLGGFGQAMEAQSSRRAGPDGPAG